MREPFEIVDPIESFTEAREAVSAGVETSIPGRTMSYQALLAGVAIVAISALIFVNTLSPRMFAPKVDDQLASDMAVSTTCYRASLAAIWLSQLPTAGSICTCNRPGTSAAQSSEKPAPLSTATGGQQAVLEFNIG